MIGKNDIIQDGHPTLRKKALEVELPLTKETIEFSKSLVEYLINSQDEVVSTQLGLRSGVGLAAPQVNNSVRIFAMHIPEFGENEEDFSFIFINPKIIAHSEKMCYLDSGEGCLSVDEQIFGYVPRYKKITATAYNLKGEKFTIKLRDYLAIVFQHEYDHLNGILFTDKMETDKQKFADIEPI